MDNDELKEIRDELRSKTKEWIMTFFYNPVIKFLTVNEATYKTEIREIGIGDSIRKIPPKEDMIGIVLKIYGHEKIMEGYLLHFNPEGRAVIHEAVWTEGLDRAGLNTIFKKEVLTIKKGNYYHNFELVPEVKAVWGPYTTLPDSAYYFNYDPAKLLARADLWLAFPLALRKLIAIHLPKPEGYDLEPLPDLTGDFTIYTCEEIIFGELPRIIAYHGQGNLKYSQKGTPNQASAKKMSKALKLKEFGPDFEFPQRSLLIAGLLSEEFRMKTLSEPPEKIIKNLFTADFNRHPAAQYLLTHLKGLSYLHYHDYTPHTTARILNLFRQLPEGQWITLENLERFVEGRFIDLLPVHNWILNNKIRAEYEDPTDPETGKYSVDIFPGNTRQWVSHPYLAGHIYLLAAFGLMDIATEDDIFNAFTPYDNLYAFRLTSLGAYVLGLRDDYTQTWQNIKTTLTFDENTPLIRIEGDVTLGDTMLANYVSRLSENFYQLNPGEFLKECRSTKEVQNKIALFKQTVGQKLPRFWENYLEELVNNSKSILQQHKMKIFKIPDGDKALHQLIAQDEILRKLIMKAENYHILVPDAHSTAFSNRMKELGYVIGGA